MKPYFLVLGAKLHSHPSTVWLPISAYTQSPLRTERSSGAWAYEMKGEKVNLATIHYLMCVHTYGCDISIWSTKGK